MTKDLNIIWTRAIACLLVVLVHVAELWVYTFHVNTHVYQLTSLIVVIGKTAVPLFFMITGYLLFTKDQEPGIRLIWKRFKTIFFPILYFFSVYYIYSIIRGYSLNPVNNQFLVTNIVHLWYLGFMLPVYTFSPFIKLPKPQSKKQIFILLGIIAFFFFITESLMTDPFPFKAEYHFNQPLLYMFTGYLLKHINIKQLSIKTYCWLAFILFTTINYFIAMFDKHYFQSEIVNNIFYVLRYLLGGQETIMGGYKTMGVYLQSLFLFISLQSIDLHKTFGWIKISINTMFTYIAKHSLSIYGWHMLFVNLFREIFISLQIRYAFPVIFFISVPCSIGIGYCGDFFQRFFRRRKYK